MFTGKICLATVLLSLHAVNCYILLTANLDDMHSLAKQIAESPVANQINDIIRRAATIIKDTGVPRKNLTRKAHIRSDYRLDQEQLETDVRQPQTNEGEPKTNGKKNTDKNSAEGQKVAGHSDINRKSDSSSEVPEEINRIKPNHSTRDVGFAELGRNASYYLNSIKKIFENI